MESPLSIRALCLAFIALTGIALSAPLPLASATDRHISRLQQNAERGSIKDQLALARAYFTGKGVERNEKLAAHWYERAAHAGEPHAQRTIGYFYQVGIGVPRDPARAVQWFQRAVAGGLVSAEVDLAAAFLWGTGVRRDQALSARLFRDSADKGDARAATYLGDMHFLGLGVTPNRELARHWYEIGAKRHDTFAEYRLGLILAEDKDKQSNLRKAVSLLRKSAAAGLVPAKFALGLLITHNPQLASSPGEVDAVIQDAAAAGYWRASALQAIRIWNEDEPKPDLGRVYYWFRVARLQGGEVADPLVKANLEFLAAKLESGQRKQLDDEAKAWYEEHKVPFEFVYQNRNREPGTPLFGMKYPEPDVHIGRVVPVPQNK